VVSSKKTSKINVKTSEIGAESEHKQQLKAAEFKPDNKLDKCSRV